MRTPTAYEKACEYIRRRREAMRTAERLVPGSSAMRLYTHSTGDLSVHLSLPNNAAPVISHTRRAVIVIVRPDGSARRWN